MAKLKAMELGEGNTKAGKNPTKITIDEIVERIPVKRRKMDSEDSGSTALLEIAKSDSKLSKAFESISQEIPELDPYLFIQVFRNDSLWDIIAKNLTHSEMRNMSLVNHFLRNRIQSNKQFRNLSLFAVKINGSDRQTTVDFHPNPKMPKKGTVLEFEWKHVEIDISEPPSSTHDLTHKIIPPLKKSLSTVESIYIYSYNFYRDRPDTTANQKILLFKSILSSTPHLQSLTMSAAVFKVDLTSTLNSPEVRTLFEGLTGLHILKGLLNRTNQNLAANLKGLSSIPMTLQDFTWGEMKEEYFKHALEIIRFSQDTLTSLSIFTYLITDTYVDSIVCPRLTSLKIEATPPCDYYNHPTLARLLERQEFLRILDISYSGGSNVTAPAILGAIKSKNWELKSLRLSLNFFSYDRRDLLHGINMSDLEEFDMSINGSWSYTDDTTFLNILNSLPPHLKVLNVRGIKSAPAETAYCVRNLDSTRLYTLQMEKFEALSELSLVNNNEWDHFNTKICNDSLLQFLWSKMKKLKVLRLVNCPRVTDFGLTGQTKNKKLTNGESTIANLKSLQHLVINKCPKITESGYIRGIQFSELNFLHLQRSSNSDFRLETWQSIAKNNPNLRTIVLRDSKGGIGNILKTEFSSLTRIYNTFKSARENPMFPKSKYDPGDTPCASYFEDRVTGTKGYDCTWR